LRNDRWPGIEGFGAPEADRADGRSCEVQEVRPQPVKISVQRSRMRILLLTQFYPPIIGGEERHVRNLAAALAARGHEVSVATQASRDDAGSTVDGAVRVHRLRGTLRRLSVLFSDPERPFAPPIPDPEMTLALRAVIARE